MKKTLGLLVASVFVLNLASTAFAALPKSIDQLKSGTTDIVRSPLVIIDHTKKEVNDSDYKAVGLVKGLITSPFHMVMKAGKGALDVATFPIAK